MSILFFDTETTGLPPKKADYRTEFDQFPHVVQLSWCFNNQYYDYIIRPEGYEIPVEASNIHGITTERAIADGVPYDTVIRLFIADCLLAERVIGHNIYFDTSIIKANILRLGDDQLFTDCEEALNKTKRIDTMYKAMKTVGARKENGSGKFPTLEETYLHLFGETFPAHNAIEDVRATKRVFEELQRLEIITL